MKRDEVLAILAHHQADLKKLGVKSLAVFGSVARDEARPDSDVDLLAEFQRPFGLFKYVKLKEYLENILGCPVDLVTRDAVLEELRDDICREAVNVL